MAAGKNSRKAKETQQVASEVSRIVLVGTYKGDQLTKWRGWYNYPISNNDKICADDAAKITELCIFFIRLWRFRSNADSRTATFISMLIGMGKYISQGLTFFVIDVEDQVRF